MTIEQPVSSSDESGHWIVNGKLHRLDGPAWIKVSGEKQWWVNGQLHRMNEPSVVGVDGSEEWHIYGKRHRVDGPAIIEADGSQSWWQHGRRHREDGPAVITFPNNYQWWQHGKRHRVGGPAVVLDEGKVLCWFLFGVRVTQEVHDLFKIEVMDAYGSSLIPSEILKATLEVYQQNMRGA